MKKRRLSLVLLFGILLGVISLGITLYPLIGNYLSEKNKSTVLTEYARTVDKLEDTSIREMLAEAQVYNNSLMPGTLSMENIFSRAGHAVAEERYYDLLAVSSDGIMGYVEIPKINVHLPIYHGTETDTLEKGTGHLIGSSLPVGGENTHTVITGHSGMASQRMFTDLEQIEVGDVFYLHVLKDVLAYQVFDTEPVLPHDTERLKISSGEDLCTLITCYPTGINSHRLLVLGKRIPYEAAQEAQVEIELEVTQQTSNWQEQYLFGILLGVTGVLVIALVLLAVVIYRRKQPDRKAGRYAKK